MLRKAARKEQPASQEDARALRAKALPTAVSPVTPGGDVWFEGSPENVSGDTHCQAVWARHGSRVPGAGRTADGALSPHNTAQDRELPSSSLADPDRGHQDPAPGAPQPGVRVWKAGGTHCSVKSSLLVSVWLLPHRGCCHWWAAWGHWWWLACPPSPLARLGGCLRKAVATGCSAGHPESLPGYPAHCLAAKKDTQTSVQVAAHLLWPSVTPEWPLTWPGVEEAHKPAGRGLGRLPRAFPLLWGSLEWHWHPSKVLHGDIWFYTLGNRGIPPCVLCDQGWQQG